MGKIDIITGTLGKALGGASGGYTSGRQPVIDLLRQRSRPYLFSNTIAPPVVVASLKAIELLTATTELRDKLEQNTKYFRAALTARGLTIKPGTHPIVPIMIGADAKSQKFAARMLERRLRHWFLLSGRAPWDRRVRAGLGGSLARGFGICRQRVRGNECRAEITYKRQFCVGPPDLQLAFMQRAARTHPRFVLIEVYAHHFALTHPDKIIHQNRIRLLFRPDEHHPDFSL